MSKKAKATEATATDKPALVPQLRFPEFRNAGEWREKAISEICRVTQGGTPDTSVSSFWGGSVQWITPAEMGKTESKFIEKTARTITEDGLRNCSSELLPIDSVIISTRAPIGHLAINKTPMAINQGCRGLIPNQGYEGIFIYYTLEKFKGQLNDLGSGNTFKELSGTALKGFTFPAPKLPEQQKIADCLSSVDELIAAQAQKVEALKAHKKGLMQLLFPAEGQTIPALRFPEFRKAPEWVEKKLGDEDVSQIYKGKGISKADISVDGVTPCIRYGELYTIYDEVIDAIQSRTNSPLDGLFLSKKNDVIIPASGETKEDIATAACVLHAGVALGGDLNVIRTSQNGVFLSYYLNGPLSSKIAKVAQGDTVVHLYPSQLLLLDVKLPRPQEQQKIADCLSSLDELIAAEAQKVEALKVHKKGLMQQLFPAVNEVQE